MVAQAEPWTYRPDRLPDGPKGPPLWLLSQWILRPCQLMEESARRYGDVFTVRWTLAPAVMVSHPQGVQEIFRTDPAEFDIGQQNSILQPIVGNDSLLLLDGDRHQRQRQLLMPPFHGERMRAYGELIEQITRQVFATHTHDGFFEVRAAMQDISLKVILKAVFGLVEGERYEYLQTLLKALLALSDSPIKASLLFIRSLQQDWGAWSPWGRFVRQRAEIDQLLYEEIRNRRAHPNPEAEDILSLLLSAHDEEGNSMSDQELRDELVTLLMAGHETTASALAWAFYWIHQTPGVLDTLKAELATIDPTDFASIARLPYLNAICQETLRIYPIAPITFPRFTRHPFELMGQPIPPGTLLFPCIYLLHRRPDLYPDPETFRPERFLERQFTPYEFISFGGGNRRCIGMAFALYEMKLVLATALIHWSLELAPTSPLRPIRRGVTLAPPSTLRMRIRT
ncbi:MULTISPECIES: cytochrome P450 [unclassified Leptolyngbya]|uniref:cytochrome P450 n=1 Tax=unclassified Leptolyngbya TaxID=2650499 RepID=UPI0016891037|nr:MULTISPECIES: cytochrome P450 [unclassified Leptolyngbya]MBD1910683.1 cytochrome P450 [Leptolyngbya sp. FACHB-8]MBD2154280.1 cytochrome P450 [Leptolyngbya sp. FACHB-16]